MHMLSTFLKSGIALSVRDDYTPSNKEWDDYLQMLTANLDAVRGMVVFSQGGGPTAAQRAQMANVWARRDVVWEVAGSRVPPILYVTDSRLTRAAMSAWMWVTKTLRMQACSESEAWEVLGKYYSLDSDAVREIMETAFRLRAAIAVQKKVHE